MPQMLVLLLECFHLFLHLLVLLPRAFQNAGARSVPPSDILSPLLLVLEGLLVIVAFVREVRDLVVQLLGDRVGALREVGRGGEFSLQRRYLGR